MTDILFYHFGSFFCSFDPPNLKNQNFEKWKKCLGILSFCKWVPKMMIIWYMVPEIWNKKDRIFCHFGLFFALLPANNSENKKFEKKKSGDIILLRVSTIYENHIMYGSWDMEHNRIFFILDRFLHFYSSNNQEKQNYKKIENNALTCNINDDHMIYGSWNLMRHAEFFVILGHFLTFYPTNNLVTSRNGDRKITQSH